MKICHVLTNGGGGGAVYAEALARGIRSRGGEVAWAVLDGGAAAHASALPGLVRTCAGADVVHAHGFRAGLIAAPLSHNLVVTPHGSHLVRRSRGLERRRALVAVRGVAYRSRAVICVSAEELADLEHVLGRSAAKLRHVANGSREVALPTEQDRLAARRSLQLDASAPTLAFVARLEHQKDPLLALRSFHVTRALLPEARLVVAGDGSLAGPVRAGAGEGVVLLGHVPDPSSVLVAADAALNTSRWEGMSLSLLESMWRGRPAVAVNAAGNAEAIAGAGVLVDSRDPRELGAAAAALLGDRPRLAALGASARERAERLFTEERMIEETWAVYERCAGTVARRSPPRQAAAT